MMPGVRESTGSRAVLRDTQLCITQPANPEKPWCKHSERAWRLWATLTDGSSNDTLLPHLRKTRQPEEQNAEREPVMAVYQLAKVLVRRRQHSAS